MVISNETITAIRTLLSSPEEITGTKARADHKHDLNITKALPVLRTIVTDPSVAEVSRNEARSLLQADSEQDRAARNSNIFIFLTNLIATDKHHSARGQSQADVTAQLEDLGFKVVGSEMTRQATLRLQGSYPNAARIGELLSIPFSHIGPDQIEFLTGLVAQIKDFLSNPTIESSRALLQSVEGDVNNNPILYRLRDSLNPTTIASHLARYDYEANSGNIHQLLVDKLKDILGTNYALPNLLQAISPGSSVKRVSPQDAQRFSAFLQYLKESGSMELFTKGIIERAEKTSNWTSTYNYQHWKNFFVSINCNPETLKTAEIEELAKVLHVLFSEKIAKQLNIYPAKEAVSESSIATSDNIKEPIQDHLL